MAEKLVKAERLLLENQIAIMQALGQVPGVSMVTSSLHKQIDKTTPLLKGKDRG